MMASTPVDILARRAPFDRGRSDETRRLLPIPGEVIVDLTGRKAQLHRCPADSLPHWQVAVDNPVKFASDPNRLRPSLV
jgi:hypothetical protein